MTHKQLKNFLYQKEEAVYLLNVDHADYWRKYYSLQSLIYRIHPERIENCGYYLLDEKQLEIMYKFIQTDCEQYGEEFEGIPEYDPETETLLCHEWY